MLDALRWAILRSESGLMELGEARVESPRFEGLPAGIQAFRAPRKP